MTHVVSLPNMNILRLYHTFVKKFLCVQLDHIILFSKIQHIIIKHEHYKYFEGIIVLITAV
jgi:hypothetical protein